MNWYDCKTFNNSTNKSYLFRGFGAQQCKIKGRPAARGRHAPWKGSRVSHRKVTAGEAENREGENLARPLFAAAPSSGKFDRKRRDEIWRCRRHRFSPSATITTVTILALGLLDRGSISALYQRFVTVWKEEEGKMTTDQDKICVRVKTIEGGFLLHWKLWYFFDFFFVLLWFYFYVFLYLKNDYW